MHLCFDLDGVICELRNGNENYGDVQPKPGAVEKLKALKRANHTIIIFTARHMKTCDENIGKVLALQGLNALDWLRRHQIPFDEIYFGKPWADVYVDDNGYRFSNWDDMNLEVTNLPSPIGKSSKDVP